MLGAETPGRDAPRTYGDEPDGRGRRASGRLPSRSRAPTRRRSAPAGASAVAPAPRLAPAEAAPEAAAAPRVKLGGTLFERMSNVGARCGARRRRGGADKDPLDIPRFLHRQNNQ